MIMQGVSMACDGITWTAMNGYERNTGGTFIRR
jgi:hypothetical protein